MGGCSAMNCSNHSRKKHRMFKFPKDKERRAIWTNNCRRKCPNGDDWEPGPNAQLCIDHFEECQFEQNRQDGWKKLKQSAIPTLFTVPNPPPTLGNKRIKGIGRPKPNSLLGLHLNTSEQKANSDSIDELKRKLATLEKENEDLKTAIKEKDIVLSKFLSAEQIASLYVEKRSIAFWSDEAIIKALKLRFALGKHGYNYIRSTGYPSPSYSTINKRIQDLKFGFGTIDTLFQLLQTKVETMGEEDRNCCLLLDEMEIADIQDFDISTKSFVGNTTLGKPTIASHYMVVMLRGIRSPWKQIVAHELTSLGTNGSDIQKLVADTISAARKIGLKVRASTSDMGGSNQGLWSSLNVSVTKTNRTTSYTSGSIGNQIHAVADVPHLIKRMRSAFLSHMTYLPLTVPIEYDLPSGQVSSSYIKELWHSELKSDSTLRSLHHLNKSHLFPSHFQTMNVATAVQLFSVKTAAALEKAVRLKQIRQEALATAWWIRLLAQWFEMMTARQTKCAITPKNKNEKFRFLNYFISIMQDIQLGKGQGWKPLQTGMILSSLSVINLATELFSEGFTFFLPGRLTQDALENVFGQIRRKSGAKPTALQAKMALRLICISQFVSDIKNASYSCDSDYHLLDVAAALKKSAPQMMKNAVLPHLTGAAVTETAAPSTRTPLAIAVDENDIYFIAGATLNALLKKRNICPSCIKAIKEAKDSAEPDVPNHRTILTEYCDLGGLQKPESGLYRICREAERAFQKYKNSLLLHEFAINESFVDNIASNCRNVDIPTCCKLKQIIINHYLIVRCKGMRNYMANKRTQEASFGSASANKKQKKE